MHASANNNPVASEDACPKCGQRSADELVWIDDEQVQCASCGTVYGPPRSKAARFVAQLRDRAESGKPIHASTIAREVDPAVRWERTDCNTMIFYSFADGSKAGTKPAKPLAMRKGQKYQAWVVGPEGGGDAAQT